MKILSCLLLSIKFSVDFMLSTVWLQQICICTVVFRGTDALFRKQGVGLFVVYDRMVHNTKNIEQWCEQCSSTEINYYTYNQVA